MIDLKDFSIISVVSIDSPERTRNLKITLDYMLSIGCNYELIVVECNTDSRDVLKYDNLIYKHFKLDCFAKSYLINKGIELSSRKYVILMDADVIISEINLKKSVDYIYEGNILSYPCEQVCKCSKETTDNILLKCMDNIPLSSDERFANEQHVNIHGGLFVFNKKKIMDILGFNQLFLGYGYEDDEFCWRIKKLYGENSIKYNFGEKLYHLYHPNIWYSDGSMLINKCIFEYMKLLDKERIIPFMREQNEKMEQWFTLYSKIF